MRGRGREFRRLGSENTLPWNCSFRRTDSEMQVGVLVGDFLLLSFKLET